MLVFYIVISVCKCTTFSLIREIVTYHFLLYMYQKSPHLLRRGQFGYDSLYPYQIEDVIYFTMNFLPFLMNRPFWALFTF